MDLTPSKGEDTDDQGRHRRKDTAKDRLYQKRLGKDAGDSLWHHEGDTGDR